MISADNHRANSNWLKLKLIWIWKPIGDNAVNLLKGTRPDKALPIHTHTLTVWHTWNIFRVTSISGSQLKYGGCVACSFVITSLWDPQGSWTEDAARWRCLPPPTPLALVVVDHLRWKIALEIAITGVNLDEHLEESPEMSQLVR